MQQTSPPFPIWTPTPKILIDVEVRLWIRINRCCQISICSSGWDEGLARGSHIWLNACWSDSHSLVWADEEMKPEKWKPKKPSIYSSIYCNTCMKIGGGLLDVCVGPALSESLWWKTGPAVISVQPVDVKSSKNVRRFVIKLKIHREVGKYWGVGVFPCCLYVNFKNGQSKDTKYCLILWRGPHVRVSHFNVHFNSQRKQRHCTRAVRV